MDAARQDMEKDEKAFSIRFARSPLQMATADPYTVPGSFNAPWLAWILARVPLLSVHMSGVISVARSTLVGLWCIHRLGARLLATVLCLLSPAHLRFATSGQVDAVPLLGIVLLLTMQELGWRNLGVRLLAWSIHEEKPALGALSTFFLARYPPALHSTTRYSSFHSPHAGFLGSRYSFSGSWR